MVKLVAPSSRAPVDVTVFIPTYNGEKYLERLLSAVENQDFPGTVEILVIDSGSTDATLEIIARHASVRLKKIPKSEFGHGKTRNLAASLARGNTIVYLSHDAVPLGSTWLTHLCEPLDSPDCWVVYGRQVARPDCFPSLKYEIDGVFAAGDSGADVTVVTAPDGDVDFLTEAQLFHSDVNAATRRDVVLNQVPFRDVAYSEDLAFARDVLARGKAKAYARLAIVEHSNDVTLAQYGGRVFDETLGRRRAGHNEPAVSILGMLARLARDTARTSVRICRDSSYGVTDKIRWLAVSPAYVTKKWVNIRRAQRTSLDDETRIRRYSLEQNG